MSKYLAVDIGASSGRIFEAELKDQKIYLEEIHRFEDYLRNENDSFFWDTEKLYNSIINGLDSYFKKGGKASSIGIDTWGVDFILLDENDKATPAVSYRDPRTANIMEKFFKIMDKKIVYEKTGIQFMEFNTIYQLYSMKLANDPALKKAVTFLMIPDYLNFLLTGEKVNEITNVSTTQMLNYKTMSWDKEILEKLDMKIISETKLEKPGYILGNIKDNLKKMLNTSDLKVILPGTHDTASAIAAIPHYGEGTPAYISSGTWSLMGVESEYAVNEKSYDLNFTNEASVIDGKSRLLKNIMGLWLIQRVKKEFEDKYTFAEIVELAKAETEFDSLINPNSDNFLNPKSMKTEIYEFCKKTNQKLPENIGQYGKIIFYSLAFLYKKTLDEIRELTNLEIDTIHIIGGGSQNEYLNQLTADAAHVKVVSGPVEATVLGNVIVQAAANGDVKNIEEGRRIIKDSSELKEFLPKEDLERLYGKFLGML